MIKLKINVLFFITFITLLISPFQKYALYALLSIFVHELGHFIIIHALKRKIKKFEITPIGCYFVLEVEKDESLFDKLLIYSFGVLGNIALILLSIVIKNEILFQMNVGMLVFNIMPIPPLDGYHFLLYLLSIRLPYKKALKAINIIAVFFLIGFSVSILWSKSGFLMIGYCIYFLILLFHKIKAIQAEYSMFLIRKYCNPNYVLPIYKNQHIDLPLENNLLFGKRNVFVLDYKIVDEKRILKNKYKTM